ncbi:MAG: hypothetical protein GXY01_10210 [Clostridiales bacterium]|nr:hypothetical protein [Clostridiales bacterium]
MKKFNNGAKTGLMIELIAGIVMAIFVLIEKPIPDLVAWIFIAGLIITLISAFIVKRNK